MWIWVGLALFIVTLLAVCALVVGARLIRRTTRYSVRGSLGVIAQDLLSTIDRTLVLNLSGPASQSSSEASDARRASTAANLERLRTEVETAFQALQSADGTTLPAVASQLSDLHAEIAAIEGNVDADAGLQEEKIA